MQGASADAAICATLLQGCAKSSRLGDAGSVADYLSSRGERLPLKEYAAMLQSLPQRTALADALGFMDVVEPCVSYRDAAGHSYFRHFSRLLIQEFLTEAEQALERIARRPPDALQASGLALLGVRATVLQKGGQLELSAARPGLDLAGMAKEAFNKGDTILIAPMADPYAHMQQQKGGWGQHALPPGMPGPPPPSMGGGASTSGAGAMEAEVLSVLPKLVVKLLSCGASGGASGDALCAPGVLLRCDKLANRITAARQLDALRLFADAEPGSNRSGGVEPTLRSIVCGDPSEAGGAAVVAACLAPPADATTGP